MIQSERYQRLVNDNAAFRRARMIKECGPVTDPQLHEQCIASFNHEFVHGVERVGSSSER